MNWTTEAKVGFFTVIGLVCLVFSLLFLGHAQLFGPPQIHFTGQFTTANGLQAGNAVQFSGVPVGKVTKVKVSGQGVDVEMEVNKDVEIPIDSTLTITTNGFIGDKLVAITPGKSKTYITSGDVIKGSGTGSMDKVLDQADKMMQAATKTMNSINAVIGDKKTQDALKNTLQMTQVIAQNTADLTGQLNSMAGENRGNIHAITSNMVGLTENMEGITNQLDTTLKNIDGDGQTSTEIRQIVGNLQQTTNSINKMASSMEGVVTSPENKQDIETVLHNTAQLTTKLNRLTGGDVKGGQSPFKVETGVEMLYNNQTDKYSPNANFRLFAGKNAIELGATHIGDGSHLEVTYGKEVANKFFLQGGLYEGQVGVGMAYGLGTPFSLSLAAYDPNDLTYRLRSEFRLYNDTYAVAQFVRPYSAEYGGNYFGIRQAF